MRVMKKINKTALVTGGARRIGKAIAQALHNAGHNVVIHCNSSVHEAEQLSSALNQIRSGSSHVIAADLLAPNSSDSIIEFALEKFGALDLLVNNASTFYPTELSEINNSAWNDLMGSNLRAPLFLCQAAAPALRTANGAIINIIDIYARRPLVNHSVYCAAKAGLEMLTKSLAVELAPQIRVNGVAPGAILWPENDDHPLVATELIKKIPLQRFGDPSDIAQTVVFLATQAPYITGQIIAVDGGRSVVV